VEYLVTRIVMQLEEEISTLRSVFYDKFNIINTNSKEFELTISLNSERYIRLHFIIPSSYPEKCPTF